MQRSEQLPEATAAATAHCLAINLCLLCCSYYLSLTSYLFPRAHKFLIASNFAQWQSTYRCASGIYHKGSLIDGSRPRPGLLNVPRNERNRRTHTHRLAVSLFLLLSLYYPLAHGHKRPSISVAYVAKLNAAREAEMNQVSACQTN